MIKRLFGFFDNPRLTAAITVLYLVALIKSDANEWFALHMVVVALLSSKTVDDFISEIKNKNKE